MVTSEQGPDDGTVPLSTVEELELVGGDACLDFVNTASNRTGGPVRDRLVAYGDLVTFAERVGEVGPQTAARLRSLAEADPAAAEAVLRRARELREAIYRSFSAMARRETASPADLAILGEGVARASAHRLLVPTADGCEYEYSDADALDRPLWPIALAAAELATSKDVSRVKECASQSCNWLFLDVSKNRSRRWCDMKDCGNRAKARRFRQRTKSS